MGGNLCDLKISVSPSAWVDQYSLHSLSTATSIFSNFNPKLPEPVLTIISRISGDVTALEAKESKNRTTTRIQREVNERERRLIPYTTYYLTQGFNPNSGVRQNIFIPITTSRENVLNYEAVPQIPTSNLQNGRLQNPSFITTPTVKIAEPRLQYKSKIGEIHTPEPIFRYDPEALRPQIQLQSIQSATRPQEVTKINPTTIESKFIAPQLIKIIPVIKKLPSQDETSRPFIFPTPQYAYTRTKVQTLIPNTQHGINNKDNYDKPVAPLRTESSYKGDNAYGANVVQQYFEDSTPQGGLVKDKDKYAFVKIFYSSTTASPYTTDFRSHLDGSRTPKPTNNFDPIQDGFHRQLNPTLQSHSPEPVEVRILHNLSPEKLKVSDPDQKQIYYYNQDINEGKQNRINYQGSQEATRDQEENFPLSQEPQTVTQVTQNFTPVPVINNLRNVLPTIKHVEDGDEGTVNVNKKTPIPNFLTILKEADNMPQNLTPENIDNGIKTLALILERLQQQERQNIQISSTPKPSTLNIKNNIQDHKKKIHSFPQPSGTSTPGRPGIDYPVHSSIPQTNFDCSTQRYKGFFGDPDTNCQVWHYCDLNGGQASFLCPNGTIFSQVALTCDWWFNVKCASTSQLYVLNERLYKYILPFSPSFPEDYSGPVVDRYLSAKFKEMETKAKIKALKSLITTPKPNETINTTTSTVVTLEESKQ